MMKRRRRGQIRYVWLKNSKEIKNKNRRQEAPVCLDTRLLIYQAGSVAVFIARAGTLIGEPWIGLAPMDSKSG